MKKSSHYPVSIFIQNDLLFNQFLHVLNFSLLQIKFQRSIPLYIILLLFAIALSYYILIGVYTLIEPDMNSTKKTSQQIVFIGGYPRSGKYTTWFSFFINANNKTNNKAISYRCEVLCIEKFTSVCATNGNMILDM